MGPISGLGAARTARGGARGRRIRDGIKVIYGERAPRGQMGAALLYTLLAGAASLPISPVARAEPEDVKLGASPRAHMVDSNCPARCM